MRKDLIDEYLPQANPSVAGIDSPMHKNRVIVIAGPTATGKSRLSLELARILSGEIISADSIQVYRGMDIGTAKVARKKRMEIPHHLVDICDLSDSFNVVQFYEEAIKICAKILDQGHVPIVVGGTGFYLHTLLYGPPQGPKACKKVRLKLEKDLEDHGVEPLYQKLCYLDPHYGNTINKCDKHKIIRALEIITLTGKKVSDFPKSRKLHRPKRFDFRCWFIYFPKEILFSRIEMRCDEMISRGLIQEVKGLIKNGLKNSPSPSRAIGYRQCIDFLSSNRSDEEWERFVWRFKKASRTFARRQFTWFRQEPLFHWIDLDICGYQKTLERILQDYESRY